MVGERQALPNIKNENQSVRVAQYRQEISKLTSESAQSWEDWALPSALTLHVCIDT